MNKPVGGESPSNTLIIDFKAQVKFRYFHNDIIDSLVRIVEAAGGPGVECSLEVDRSNLIATIELRKVTEIMDKKAGSIILDKIKGVTGLDINWVKLKLKLINS